MLTEQAHKQDKQNLDPRHPYKCQGVSISQHFRGGDMIPETNWLDRLIWLAGEFGV